MTATRTCLLQGRLLLMVLLVWLGGGYQAAFAAPCTMPFGPPTPIDINVPTLTVSRDLPVGSEIGRVTSPGGTSVFSCSTANNRYVNTLYATIAADGTMPVLDQSGNPIPGLGVRLYGIRYGITAHNECGPLRSYVTNRTNLSCLAYFKYEGKPGEIDIWNIPITLAFIKTSNLLGNAVLGQKVVTSYQVDSYPPQIYRIAGGSKIIANACTFTIPPAVSLGNLKIGDLTNNQSSTPAPFSLGINCSASSKVKINLTAGAGSQPVSGRAGRLTNSDTSANGAQGVSVELRDANQQPVALGTNIDYGTQPAVALFNFTARMVPDGTNAKAGNVKAGLVVNFTFN